MKKTGYIEGYFGRHLTWEQRHGLVEHLSSLGMNCYLYAPKEDPYHRVKWKEEYPKEWADKIHNLADEGKKRGVEVVPALAPGLSYDYTSEEDYRILLGKFKLYIKMNVDTVALLMDDISADLPENCKDRFSSLGDAHAQLICKLQEDLRKEHPKMQLWFCPTIYSDEFVEGEAADSKYIIDLAAALPGDVPLLWTGDKVVSKTITKENVGRIQKLFNNNLIIWDNYYAHDYSTYRLFIGPLAGREPELIDQISGIMINPTGLYVTDKFLLSLTGDFLAEKSATTEGWKKVAKEFDIHPNIFKIREYFWSPFTVPEEDFFSKELLDSISDFYHGTIITWQNPLRLEWFPFLYSFFIDMQYMSEDIGQEDWWLENRYPPAISWRLKKLRDKK